MFPIMRRHKFYVLIISALILVSDISVSLAAEMKPLPTNNCMVNPSPSWSKQEKLVWKAICAGNDFDFNKLPGFGPIIEH